jgi:hypothetical protein
MKFDNFSAVDSGYSNFVITNAPNPFVYSNVLSVDVYSYPTSGTDINIYPNRKVILQTKRLGAYNGVNEFTQIFPKLVQARNLLFKNVLNQTQFTTQATLQLTEQMYDTDLANINATIIPLGYRIDKTIKNNLSILDYRQVLPCGNSEVLLPSLGINVNGWSVTKWQYVISTPKLNVPGSCFFLRLVNNGNWTSNSNIGSNQLFLTRAFAQALASTPLVNVICGTFPKTTIDTNLTYTNQDDLLALANQNLKQINNDLLIYGLKLEVVQGRVSSSLISQISSAQT